MRPYNAMLRRIACLLVIGLAAAFLLLLPRESAGDETILLNDIGQTAREHWEDLAQMAGYDFGVPYVVFDAQERVIFASAPTDITSLGDAMRCRYPYLMLTEQEKLLGGVVVLESREAALRRQRMQAFCAIAAAGGVILGCMLLWGMYVKRRIVAPFRRMERFAGQVAAGDLDVPLQMEQDNLFGIFTESFDIMREELARSREREIELKRREKELIASLSHDLRTPVTGIRVTAELMQAQTHDPHAAEKLRSICQKADQIDTLVSDLFTATLKDLGEMQVSVSEESSQLLHELVQSCDDRGLVTEGDIPECLISIDPRRMRQVIGNILTNSYKYAGTPVTITYTIIEGYLKMRIRDTGPGVPEEELPLLTNKFYRSKTLRDGSKEGSGLGLYIARLLIENMNGELRCVNAAPGFEVRVLVALA